MKGIFIICNNGLGHFRRSLRIANALKKQVKNLELRLYCSSTHLSKTKGWSVLEKLLNEKNILFESLENTPFWDTNNSRYSDANLLNWHTNIPKSDLINADFVISDNLPQILKLNPDSVLMGSFLWSEVLKPAYPEDELIQKFHDEEVEILQKHRPYMICQSDMAMPYITRYTRPVETGWMTEESFNCPTRNKIEHILVSGGGTPHAEAILEREIQSLLRLNYTVHTSKRLIALLSTRTNLYEFDFSSKSFEEIDLMIARPGIGAITDAVAYKIPILATGEINNPELVFNAQKVEELELGINLYESAGQASLWVQRLDQSERYQRMQKKLMEAPQNGIEEAVQFLINHFCLNVS